MPPHGGACPRPCRRPPAAGQCAAAGRRHRVRLPSPERRRERRACRRPSPVPHTGQGATTWTSGPRVTSAARRATRRFRMLRQSEVARAAGVSRQWLGALEQGKATLEIGLVLRTFEALGVDLHAVRAAPPDWTVQPTADAEMREARTIFGRRRRRYRERMHERDIAEGISWRISARSRVVRIRPRIPPPRSGGGDHPKDGGGGCRRLDPRAGSNALAPNDRGRSGGSPLHRAAHGPPPPLHGGGCARRRPARPALFRFRARVCKRGLQPEESPCRRTSSRFMRSASPARA